MKVGIVVPYSWSFGGGVVDHAEAQARSLEALGIETRLLIGNDPPGSLSRILHPRTGRHGDPPPRVIPLGRSVIVPGNGALSNLVISPPALPRLRRTLANENFDLIHVHEPLAPMLSPGALALWDGPAVATFHAAGETSWRPLARFLWGFLLDRLDLRIAVSEQAARTAADFAAGDYQVIPNGVELPPEVDPGTRRDQIVFLGRHDPRKGLPVLLRAWPRIHRATGARLRLIGTDPLQYRLLHARMRFDEQGIDMLGVVPNEVRTHELERAKLSVTPALGGESFGLVIAEAFACATPVVATDIPGYAAVAIPEAARLVPPGEVDALADAVIDVLSDEGRRIQMGVAARAHAIANYAWDDIARRLEETYLEVAA